MVNRHTALSSVFVLAFLLLIQLSSTASVYGCTSSQLDVLGCPACPAKCTGCTGTVSAMVCSACSDATTRGASPTCTCAAGYYEANAILCPACNVTCSTCSGPSGN